MDGRAELASCSERRIEGREGTAGRGGAVLNANLPSGFSHSLTLEQQTHQTNFPALALVFLLLPSLPLYCLHLIFGLFFFAPLFLRGSLLLFRFAAAAASQACLRRSLFFLDVFAQACSCSVCFVVSGC